LLTATEYELCCPAVSRVTEQQLLEMLDEPGNLELDDAPSDEEEADILEAEDEVD